MFDADVEPSRGDGQPDAALALPPGGRCEPLYIDFGSMKLGVAILEEDRTVRSGGETAGARGQLANRVHKELEQVARSPGSLVELHDRPAPGDWTVRVQPDRVGAPRTYLVPALGWTKASEAVDKSPLFGPAPDDTLGAWLRDRLQRIARARNLVKLCGDSQNELSRGAADSLLKVELIRFRDKQDLVGQVVQPGPDGIILTEGEITGFRLRNEGLGPRRYSPVYRQRRRDHRLLSPGRHDPR